MFPRLPCAKGIFLEEFTQCSYYEFNQNFCAPGYSFVQVTKPCNNTCNDHEKVGQNSIFLFGDSSNIKNQDVKLELVLRGTEFKLLELVFCFAKKKLLAIEEAAEEALYG